MQKKSKIKQERVKTSRMQVFRMARIAALLKKNIADYKRVLAGEVQV